MLETRKLHQALLDVYVLKISIWFDVRPFILFLLILSSTPKSKRKKERKRKKTLSVEFAQPLLNKTGGKFPSKRGCFRTGTYTGSNVNHLTYRLFLFQSCSDLIYHSFLLKRLGIKLMDKSLLKMRGSCRLRLTPSSSFSTFYMLLQAPCRCDIRLLDFLTNNLCTPNNFQLRLRLKLIRY